MHTKMSKYAYPEWRELNMTSAIINLFKKTRNLYSRIHWLILCVIFWVEGLNYLRLCCEQAAAQWEMLKSILLHSAYLRKIHQSEYCVNSFTRRSVLQRICEANRNAYKRRGYWRKHEFCRTFRKHVSVQRRFACTALTAHCCVAPDHGKEFTTNSWNLLVCWEWSPVDHKSFLQMEFGQKRWAEETQNCCLTEPVSSWLLPDDEHTVSHPRREKQYFCAKLWQ